MEIKYKQFSEKLDSLPEEVVFYFSNEISGRAVLDLAKEYKIDNVYVYNLVFDAVNTGFDFDYLKKEIDDIDLAAMSKKSFFQDFIGKILLPIFPYIKNKDFKNELIKLGGDPNLYEEGVDDFAGLIENENFKNLDVLIDLKEKADINEEKSYSLDLLSKHLVEILTADTPEATLTLNSGLIYLLNIDSEFKNESDKALFNNAEILTDQNLIIEDKELSPTIAHWLKDFIKVNGSNIFDELTLAQYLTNSANVKKLKPGEKDLLRKLLKLYRNLAFFSESMENIPIEDWQIIPVSYEEIALHQFKKKKELVESRDVLNDKKEESTSKEESVTKAEDVPEEVKPIDELENILTSYKPGTLEHKAVTQEIGRLNKKSRK